MKINVIDYFCYCDQCFPDKYEADRKLVEDVNKMNLDLARKLHGELDED